MTEKNLLLLRRSRKVHLSAFELGAKLTAVMEQKQLSGTDLSIYERTIGVKNDATEQEWIDAAKYACTQANITHLGVFSEPAEYIGLAVAKALELPYLNIDQINRTHDKVFMREHLREVGIDQTFSCALTTPDEAQLKTILSAQQCALILKPRDSRASAGVSLIRNVDDIQPALDWLAQSGDYDSVIVEEYLEGPEYSVESFSSQGEHHIIAITEKFKESKHFVELGHTVPAELTADQQAQIGQYVQSVYTALGITGGPGHTEVILTANGPAIVETHLRVGGDQIDELIKRAHGVDLNKLWVQQVLDPDFTFDTEQLTSRAVAGIRYFVPDQTGTVTQIQGIDTIYALEGVVSVKTLIGPNEKISTLSDSNARAMSIEVIADSRQALEAIFEQAFSLLEYKVE